MKKQDFAGKTIRVVTASLLAAGLALPSGMAFANSSTTDVADASFTLTGLASGDVAHFYQIIDTDIDANNNLSYTIKATGLPEAYDSVEKIEAQYGKTGGGRTVADAIAAAVTLSVTATNATANTDGKATTTLNSGYYLVTVTSNSSKTKVYQTLLVDATPSITDGKYVTRTLEDTAIKVQDVPAPTKKIMDESNNAANSTDTYSVGDTAKFVITGTIPSYPTDATYATYSITDVPDTGLTVDTTTNFEVKDSNSVALTKDTDYTLTTNANGSFTVAFKKDFVLHHLGQNVTINYNAKINSINLETGKIGNKAYGTFTPNPYEDKNVDTDENNPYDQTYGFSFKKVYKQDDGSTAILAGAEFTITDNTTGDAVTYIDATGTTHNDGKVTSDANGYIYVNGLENGTYTVTETKVPAGYQKVKPFEITLDTTVNGDSPATATVTEENFKNLADVVDPKTGALPTTGGAGTIALTAGGILLVIGGSIVLLRSRRRNEADAQ